MIAEVIRVSMPLSQLVGIIGVTASVGMILGHLITRR